MHSNNFPGLCCFIEGLYVLFMQLSITYSFWTHMFTTSVSPTMTSSLLFQSLFDSHPFIHPFSHPLSLSHPLTLNHQCMLIHSPIHPLVYTHAHLLIISLTQSLIHAHWTIHWLPGLRQIPMHMLIIRFRCEWFTIWCAWPQENPKLNTKLASTTHPSYSRRAIGDFHSTNWLT